MKLFLGIDVGTSLIKAAAYDETGTQVAGSSKKVPVLYPQEGYAEQDMDAVWAGVASCIRTLIDSHDIEVKDIVSLSCAGQGDGVWAIDAEGKPAGLAILWCDNRASGSVARWTEAGIPERFFVNSGITLWPGCAAAILDWLKEHDRSYFDRIDTFFCCKDWVNYQLTGEKATDVSDGTIPFMDIHSGKISLEQMEMVGFDETLYKKVPKVLHSYDVIGNITGSAAEQTGLPEGLPVVTGMIDVSANAIAAGAVHSGQTFTIIGTTLLNAVLLDTAEAEPANIGFMVTSPLPNQWTRVLGSLSGTPNFDWILRELFCRDEYEDINELYDFINDGVKDIPPGANKVLYLPFIHGERSPFVNPHATASFFGIRENTTKFDLAKAVFEGVALATKHNLVSVGQEIEEIIVTGGGSVNRLWCQIFADITQATIRVPARKELGTLGAAIMAAKGIGEIESFVFDEHSGDADVLFRPNEKHKAFYQGLYELYEQTIEQMGEFWKSRNRLFNNNPRR